MSPTLKIVLWRGVQVATVTAAAILCVALAGWAWWDGSRIRCGRAGFAQAELKSLSTALEMYRIDTGSFPLEESGLQLLLKPSDPKWKGPYRDSREIPADPWGNAYQYQGLEDGTGFELVCLGPDGRPGTEDDIRELRRSP